MSKRGHDKFQLEELLTFLEEEARMKGPHVHEAVKLALEHYWKERGEAERSKETNVIPIAGELSLLHVQEAMNSTLTFITDIRTFLIKFVQPNIIAQLSPERITNQKCLTFIPKDKNFPTRYVGSWVCVCVSAALLMVLSIPCYSSLGRFITPIRAGQCVGTGSCGRGFS